MRYPTLRRGPKEGVSTLPLRDRPDGISHVWDSGLFGLVGMVAVRGEAPMGTPTSRAVIDRVGGGARHRHFREMCDYAGCVSDITSGSSLGNR